MRRRPITIHDIKGADVLLEQMGVEVTEEEDRIRAARAHKRIMLVEDDAAIRTLLHHALVHHGYQVIRVHDGHEALERMASTEPDLLLVDVMLPELDGFEFVERVRESNGSSIPVIFITALVEPHNVMAGMSLGARAYVTKPFNLCDVLRKVDHAL